MALIDSWSSVDSLLYSLTMSTMALETVFIAFTAWLRCCPEAAISLCSLGFFAFWVTTTSSSSPSSGDIGVSGGGGLKSTVTLSAGTTRRFCSSSALLPGISAANPVSGTGGTETPSGTGGTERKWMIWGYPYFRKPPYGLYSVTQLPLGQLVAPPSPRLRETMSPVKPLSAVLQPQLLQKTGGKLNAWGCPNSSGKAWKTIGKCRFNKR